VTPAIVVVGASRGGTEALGIFLAGLPGAFPVAVAVVLHRVKTAEDLLSAYLQRRCALPVCEPEDKEPLRPGHVYIAPADYHLLIDGDEVALSIDAPVHYGRPSIDPLFESAAHAYGPGTVGVILTGSNNDGARGAAAIKAKGGTVVVQDPATAESPAMPSAAIELAAVDQILRLVEIAPYVVGLCWAAAPRSRHGR
jgi:two-component system, chemotaxis family, protein-glutamate methylesterase/glutaminase